MVKARTSWSKFFEYLLWQESTRKISRPAWSLLVWIFKVALFFSKKVNYLMLPSVNVKQTDGQTNEQEEEEEEEEEKKKIESKN
jgi:hypothetical protein